MKISTQLQLGYTALLAAGMVLTGCTSTKKSAESPKSDKPENKDIVLVSTSAAPVDVNFLLSMSFTEAKTFSTQQLEFPPHLKIAADSIEVFKYTDDGKPRKARARGKVFVEMNFSEPAKALCQEAFITEDEIILRGKPILQRGGSTIEGLDDSTIFYMFGTSLRVIGSHKVSNSNNSASLLPTLGTWADGPNFLLPPLTEGAVPSDIRNQMQRAAEAEMLHQQTRELYGPATDSSTPPPPAKTKEEETKTKPVEPKKKTTTAETPPAKPEKKSFWSRRSADKGKA